MGHSPTKGLFGLQTAAVIVEKGGADVDVINKISQTPLLYACSEKHLEMGKYTTLVIG